MKHHFLHLLLLTLLSVGAFFLHNNVLAPDIMESRNMVTAREMVDEGHWLVPTMNGELRLKKPPLPTWLTAATYGVRHDSLALQRGMAGVFGWLLVVGPYLTVVEWSRRPRMALLASLVALTSYQIVLQGRTASWDIYCHAFVMLGLPPLIRGLRSNGSGAGPLALAGLLFGLSFLSKGPISLYGLLLPFLIAFGAVERPRMSGRKWASVLLAVVLTAAVGTWWYAYLYVFEPQAIHSVVEEETGNWTSYNTRPFWYYWRFWAETGAWALLTLTALLLPFFRRDMRRDDGWRLTVVWLLASVVLLSLFPEKKMRYLLPAMVPAAALVGWLADYWTENLNGRRLGIRTERALLRTNAVAILLVCLACAVGAQWLTGAWRPTWQTASFGACGLLAAALATGAVVRCRPQVLVVAVVVLFAGVEVLLLPRINEIVGNPQRHSLALTRMDARLAGIPFFHPQGEDIRPEEVWAAGRMIRPLDLQSAKAVEAHLPCAVLTQDPAAQVLPASVLAVADTLHIGLFDDNNRPKSYKRRYKKHFVYHVTLLTPRRHPIHTP